MSRPSSPLPRAAGSRPPLTRSSASTAEARRRRPRRRGRRPVLRLVLSAAHRRRVSWTARRSLRVICTATVGYDNIDVAECTRRGIAVSNSRGSLTEAVADIALSAHHRRLPARRRGNGLGARRPLGIEARTVGDDLAGSTLGIVGTRRHRHGGGEARARQRHERSSTTTATAGPTTWTSTRGTCRSTNCSQTANCIVVADSAERRDARMFGAAQFALMANDAIFRQRRRAERSWRPPRSTMRWSGRRLPAPHST